MNNDHIENEIECQRTAVVVLISVFRDHFQTDSSFQLIEEIISNRIPVFD